jgi:hypothetical protein
LVWRVVAIQGSSVDGVTGDENYGIGSQEISAISGKLGPHWVDMGCTVSILLLIFLRLSSLQLHSLCLCLLSFSRSILISLCKSYLVPLSFSLCSVRSIYIRLFPFLLLLRVTR